MLVDRISSLPRTAFVGQNMAADVESDSESLPVRSEFGLMIGCFCGFADEHLVELSENSTAEDVYGFLIYSSESRAMRNNRKYVPNGIIASILRKSSYFLACPLIAKVDDDYIEVETVKVIVWSKDRNIYPIGSVILSNVLETEDYKAIEISGRLKILND